MLVQLFLDFDRQSPHSPEIEINRQACRFVRKLAGDLALLALDIALILALNFHLLGNAGIIDGLASAGKSQ